MSKTFIIDAYNVLNSDAGLKATAESQGIDRARADLLAAVSLFATGSNAECIVVFDGVTSARPTSHKVRVVSSRSRSADDIIRETARRIGRRLVVVSNDLEIIGTARANLATVMSSEEFASQLSFTGSKKPKGGLGGASPHRIAELRERSEKPGNVDDDDVDEWKRLFGV